MTLSIFKDFINFLNDKFQGEVPNIIFFLIGIVLGIIFFFLLSLIIVFIYKISSKRKQKVIQPLEINIEYKAVVQANKDVYINVYKDASINEKFAGIGKIMLNMMESISSIYYPNSKDPMFELSIDQLVDFLSYFTDKLNKFIDNLLENRLSLVTKFTKFSIKDKKISFVFELIDKSKEEKPEKSGLISKIKGGVNNVVKKLAFKVGGNIIDKEFLDIIDSLGEDINNLYSKQPIKNGNIESEGDINE